MDPQGRNPPSQVLALRGLTRNITEADIQYDVNSLGFEPLYIRILKDKATGVSKGLALLKFATVEEAMSLLEYQNRNSLLIKDIPVLLDYGFELTSDDWPCFGCKAINFHNRTACHRCGRAKINGKYTFKPIVSFPALMVENITSPYNQNHRIEGSDDISPSPTRFLLLTGVDPGTPASTIFAKGFGLSRGIRRIWLVRDAQTNRSKEFAFVEFDNIQNAELFLAGLERQGQVNIGDFTFSVTFGRDLESLNSLFMSQNRVTGHLGVDAPYNYWDPLCSLDPFPLLSSSTQSEESSTTIGPQLSSSSLTKAASVVGLAEPKRTAEPPKKIQLQLKQWTRQAQILRSEETVEETKVFVKESSASEKKSETLISGLVDSILLVCFLCQRRFDSQEDLQRHVKESAFHQANVDSYMRLSASKDLGNEASSSLNQFRDRSAERRELFGVGADELRAIELEEAKRKQKTPTVKPSSPPVEDSVGARLLKKMGWKEGEGLGADKQGITEPVKALTLEQSGAGIGSAQIISADELAKSSGYLDRVKSSQSKRYRER